MPKALTVPSNKAQASLVEGPRLMTKQPPFSATVAIAVVGSYKSETSAPHSSNKHDKFLALLSTEKHPEQAPYNNSGIESEEQSVERREAESQLLSVRHSRYCQRYLTILRGPGARRRHHNPEHFCATGGCTHGPSPSTFPGNQSWSFAAGEAAFDAAAKEGRRPDWEPVAPDVVDYACALDGLGDKLRAAVTAGLTDLEVVVSAVDTGSLEPDYATLAELQALNSWVMDTVTGWVEGGWVARDDLQIMWRPFGTTRNLGILGPRSTPHFMVYDEE